MFGSRSPAPTGAMITGLIGCIGNSGDPAAAAAAAAGEVSPRIGLATRVARLSGSGTDMKFEVVVEFANDVPAAACAAVNVVGATSLSIILIICESASSSRTREFSEILLLSSEP